MTGDPGVLSAMTARARGLLAAGAQMEDVLRELRRMSDAPLDSIKAIRAAAGVDLSEAKDLLNSSAAWSDVRIQHEEIQATGAEAVRRHKRSSNGNQST